MDRMMKEVMTSNPDVSFKVIHFQGSLVPIRRFFALNMMLQDSSVYPFFRRNAVTEESPE